MGLANDFNDIIQKHLNIFAAWMPVVNAYKLGDYGLFSDGVFTKMGNITDDFNITFTPGSGQEASIDFTSANAKIIKFNAGAQVDVIPAGAVDAKVEIEFESEKSFLVKSPQITVVTIENINSVAEKIKKLDNWDGKWKVVHAVYNAIDPIILSTMQAGTKVAFSGEATALQQLKLGKAGLNVNTNRELGLNIHGKNGNIGLGLFRVKTKIFGGKVTEILSRDLPIGKQESFVKLDPSDGVSDDF